MKTHWYFKLFNSIKERHEFDFAELELRGLFGEVERVKNFVDLLLHPDSPLRKFVGDQIRIQDILTYEPCYGELQGFYGTKERWDSVSVERLVRRLAYTREIYLIRHLEGEPEQLLERMFPRRTAARIKKTTRYYISDGYILFRFVTNQYYLEKSQYISKVSRNEEEIDKNVEILFNFPFEELYRIPASATMQVGKRLQDYFAIREEPSLYLTHILHPYKGKFHAKMVRALLNYVNPKDEGLVMDNFAGSGTLLVEAALMGIRSVGVEINPLSVLMSNVKCQALNLPAKKLREGILAFLEQVRIALNEHRALKLGSTTLTELRFNLDEIRRKKASLPQVVKNMFRDNRTLDEVLIAAQTLGEVQDNDIRSFLLLGLSGTISDLVRRKKAEFIEVLEERLKMMYLRVYLFQRLNETLEISVGQSETYIGDTRDMRNLSKFWDNSKKISIPDEVIDAIVNSPPYSTALDYIRNDLPQLTILGPASWVDQLESEMMGNPNLRFYPPELEDEIRRGHEDFMRLPKYAKDVIIQLLESGRIGEALRTYKFFKDIYYSLREMCRVMKLGAKAVIIIGNNHYKIDDAYVEVKNDDVTADLGSQVGFVKHLGITRELEKTTGGMIRYETVLILEKLHNP